MANYYLWQITLNVSNYVFYEGKIKENIRMKLQKGFQYLIQLTELISQTT